MANVLVDDREPEALDAIISDVLGREVERAHLTTGDVVDEDRGAAIERKTAADVLDSINDGRLWGQLDRLADEFEHSCVVACGQSIHPLRADAHGGYHTAARTVMGTIASINESDTPTHAVWLPGDDTFGYYQFSNYVERWIEAI